LFNKALIDISIFHHPFLKNLDYLNEEEKDNLITEAYSKGLCFEPINKISLAEVSNKVYSLKDISNKQNKMKESIKNEKKNIFDSIKTAFLD
jgi:hypothetical protein